MVVPFNNVGKDYTEVHRKKMVAKAKLAKVAALDDDDDEKDDDENDDHHTRISNTNI